MKSWRVSFSLLFPILELTLWFVIVLTPGALDYLYFRKTAHGAANLRLQAGQFTLNLPRKRFLPFAFESAAMRESAIISLTNFPAVFIDGAVSQLVHGDVHRNPFEWTWEAWRAISFPFFALPAWWFAGRGLDALLDWRRPRWWTLLIGTLLCSGFLIMLVCFRFGMSSEDRADMEWVLWGCGLWTLMFVPFPIYWIRRALTPRDSAIIG